METDRMTVDHSSSRGALAKALAPAQGKIEGARKTAQNPHLKNRYATLADVWDACRGPLSAHGLAVVQTFEPHGDKMICVVSRLIHESGEWMQSRLILPVTKADAQGFGSAITYARRYALSALVGVTADDDDGNAASGTVAKAQPAADNSDEARLAEMLAKAKTTDDLAKAEAEAARVAKAGGLTDDARVRLRALRAEAAKRMDAA